MGHGIINPLPGEESPVPASFAGGEQFRRTISEEKKTEASSQEIEDKRD
jgi:hypothetical protein